MRRPAVDGLDRRPARQLEVGARVARLDERVPRPRGRRPSRPARAAEHVGHDPDDRRQFRDPQDERDAPRRPRRRPALTSDQARRAGRAGPARSPSAPSSRLECQERRGRRRRRCRRPPRPRPGRGRAARSAAGDRCRIASRTSASIQAAIAIASAIPGRPSGPTRTTARRAVDDDRDDRGGDRRDRVLPGVERPGEDGDQGVRGQARRGRRPA